MLQEKTYTSNEVKEMLGKSMKKFQSSMIALIRECADNRLYRDLEGRQALRRIADKLEQLK